MNASARSVLPMEATPGEPAGRDVDKVVGANVRRFRTELEYTQRQLAARLTEVGWEVGATAIAKIEAGTRSLRAREIFLLAEVLGSSPAELFRDEGADAVRRELIDAYQQAENEFRAALQEFREARRRLIDRAEGYGYELEVPRDGFATDVLRMVALEELFGEEPTSSEHPTEGLIERLHYPDKRVDELGEIYSSVLAEQHQESGRNGDGEHPEAPER